MGDITICCENLFHSVNINGIPPLKANKTHGFAVHFDHLRHALPIDAVGDHQGFASSRQQCGQHGLHRAGAGAGYQYRYMAFFRLRVDPSQAVFYVDNQTGELRFPVALIATRHGVTHPWGQGDGAGIQENGRPVHGLRPKNSTNRCATWGGVMSGRGRLAMTPGLTLTWMKRNPAWVSSSNRASSWGATTLSTRS